MTKLIPIGHGQFVNASKVIAVVAPPDKCDRCGDWFIVKDEFGDWACRCGRRFYDEKLSS